MCRENDLLLRFTNCRILRDHSIFQEDLYVRNGKIINPEKLFFDEKVKADKKINCNNCIIAPGFIDLQINGGFGIDFSYNTDRIEEGVNLVSKNLLSHGVTSFCPTLVTSPKETYHQVLPKIPKRSGGLHGAAILGVHVEGPFINVEKKGAHPVGCIKPLKGIETVLDMYGDLSNVNIITLAPELQNASQVIKSLTKMGIVVSLGHSAGDLTDGEAAVLSGATLITHLFNAMLPFHHRDPGLVGLLTSNRVPEDKTVYFGIISDGIHTHPAALRIAHRTHPEGLVLVTDAISALGLEEGQHHIGQMQIEVKDKQAFVAGTGTLCGSIASMIECVKHLLHSTDCSLEYALEAASLHPARVLGIDDHKGTLNYGADADFVVLNEKLDICSTWIGGKCVFENIRK